nr:unnamed protein product [Digitaria exilis]
MGARRLPGFFAHAFGSSIILACPPPEDSPPLGATPIWDVRKRSISFGPPLGLPLCPIFFPVGRSKLFALHSDALELLPRSPRHPPPPPANVVEDEDDDEEEDYDDDDDDEDGWSQLPKPPFSSTIVASYAVHPDGPSILVSTENILGTVATFTFHTNKLVWKKHGDWALPFTGRAHFDRHLQIFVGLSKDPETLGHLCSCDKASLNTCNNTTDGELPAPAWKLYPDKLFSANPGEKHVSATLVYLGSGSKFCLVECLSLELEDDDDQVFEDEEGGRRHRRHVYRLTKFSLKYDSKGDLKTMSRCVRYYKVPRKASIELIQDPPVAFWL